MIFYFWVTASDFSNFCFSSGLVQSTKYEKSLNFLSYGLALEVKTNENITNVVTVNFFEFFYVNALVDSKI